MAVDRVGAYQLLQTILVPHCTSHTLHPLLVVFGCVPKHSQVQRLESSEASALAAAEAARQQLREANQARLAAAAAAAETGSSSAVLSGRVAQLESQVEACRDETTDLSRQVDVLQVGIRMGSLHTWGCVTLLEPTALGLDNDVTIDKHAQAWCISLVYVLPS
jgi:hypothetical protein